jgi:hypothetical protein
VIAEAYYTSTSAAVIDDLATFRWRQEKISLQYDTLSLWFFMNEPKE